MNKVVLITPMKNEESNVKDLFESLSRQECRIYAWIIIENGSNDSTLDLLLRMEKPENIEHIFVVQFSLPNESYALGLKYATVVNRGFDEYREMVSSGVLKKADFIGILDADCFPDSNYFYQLMLRMKRDGVNISSGMGIYTNGVKDGEASDWVRGNCRIWDSESFDVAGYVIGPSADALSVAKAKIKGFVARPYLDLVYRCREMGGKSKYRYYGYTTYYRGVGFWYAFARSIKLIFDLKFKYAFGFMVGYIESMIRRDDRISDKELFDYFNVSLIGAIRNKISGGLS